MPIHPLRGETLVLVRVERDRNSGRRYVLAETHEGRRLRIPEAWTDRCSFIGPHEMSGREAKLDLSGLLRLADTVEDRGKSRKIDINPKGEKVKEGTEQKDSSYEKTKGRSMADTDGRNSARSARGICRPGAQDPSCRDEGARRRRGRK